MPRVPRNRSKTGIYHIIMRGINRQSIFEDEEDCIKFIEVLQKYKKISEYKLYAYCLMGNHLHLLLMEGKEPLEQIMRRICGSYVFWYNRKYGRVGYLFQDRYKSEPVEDDTYFLTVLRYIYQNPIKAGLVMRIEDYIWNNYNEYFQKSKVSDIDYVLDIFDTDREKAINSFKEYINKPNDETCMEATDRLRITDEEARTIIKEVCSINNATDMQKFEKQERNKYLKALKERNGLSVRQIERLTGIGREIIRKA